MKICKNCQKKEVENEIDMILSCDKCDNIRRKAFIDIKKLMTSIFKQEIRQNKTFL